MSGASGYPGGAPGTPPYPLPPMSGGAEPGIQTPPVPQPGSGTEAGSKEKGMSLFYLLRHYDKENAGIYKAQKEEKKQQKAAKEPKKKEKKEKPVKEKKGKAKKGTGFAIPGQMAPPIPPAAPGSPVPPIPPAPGGTVPGAGAGPVQGAGLSAVPPVMGTVPGAGPGQAPGVSVVPPMSGGTMPGAVRTPSSAGTPFVPGQIPGAPSGPIPPVSQPSAGAGADFGNTVILGGGEDEDGGATVIMGGGGNAGGVQPQIHPHLIRRRNNERIPISQDVFRLGRNQDFNDYVVLGNEFVGNTHCHILIRGEEYFIVDDNSKNHTFVNGVMVMPGTEVKLVHGQTVTLADEEFEFRLF